MPAQTNDLRKQRNKERQQKFWASKSAEERARLRLKYALNAAKKVAPDAITELDASAAAIDGE